MIGLSIAAAVFAAGIASVTGFGIGSLLTPALAVGMGIKLAVAVVAIPHFVATAVRFWTLRGHVNRHMFVRFGLASAIGGLAGALALTYISAAPLVILFGLLLSAAGLGNAGLTAPGSGAHMVGWVPPHERRGVAAAELLIPPPPRCDPRPE